MSEAWQYDDPMEFWEDRGSVRSERMVELRKRNAFNQFAEIPEVSDLVEALQAEGVGEVLPDATIRDKRGKYRNGDFLVVPLGEDAE